MPANTLTELTHEQGDIPTWFQYDPEDFDTYEGQLNYARKVEAYQTAPTPSFENVPTVDVTPAFNPTGAPASEVYGRDRIPESLLTVGRNVRSEWDNNPEPVEMWRIVERSKLEDGTGLTSSRILLTDSLGDVEGFDGNKHISSSNEDRMTADGSTPFVSFSTDPAKLARETILRHGFGVSDGRESVVVRVKVDPHRVLTGKFPKEEEVLLLGGVAPEEYIEAYSVEDFVRNTVPDQEVSDRYGEIRHRDDMLGRWTIFNS